MSFVKVATIFIGKFEKLHVGIINLRSAIGEVHGVIGAIIGILRIAKLAWDATANTVGTYTPSLRNKS